MVELLPAEFVELLLVRLELRLTIDSSEMGFPLRDWFNALEPFSEKLRGRVRVMFGLSGRIGPRSFWTESARIPTDTHLKNRQALVMFFFDKLKDR